MNTEHFTFHLQYKHSGTFANCKISEELHTPKTTTPRMCDPLLVAPLKMLPIIVNPVVKMRPHPAAHPLLASYKEVPHPPRERNADTDQHKFHRAIKETIK